MKYSKQREIILDYVKSNLVHPTANHVYASLKKAHPNLSLGTVYRNLNRLSDLGLIRKIEVAGAPDRFDGNIQPHYHAICMECGEMFDFQLESPQFDFASSIHGQGFHQVLSCEISVKCICDACAAGQKKH